MDDQQSICQFVSKKFKKISWQNSPNLSSTSVNSPPERFCSGSWDNGPNNEIAIWRVDNEANKFVKCSKFPSSTDVEDLLFFSEEGVLYSNSVGDLNILRYDSLKSRLDHVSTYLQLHNGACTSFVVSGQEVVSAGEDGRLKLVNMSRPDVSDVCGHVQSSQFYCVSSFGHKEFVTGNAVGQLQLWDLRNKTTERLMGTCAAGVKNSGSALSVRCHPSQKHLAIVGYQSGAVVFWDMRKIDYPAGALQVHDGPVWDVKFHNLHPTNFFTVSNDGALIHWDAACLQNTMNTTGSSWFLNDTTQSKLKLVNVLGENVFPVNCVDAYGDTLLACADNEVIWLLRNIKLSC